jgi:hypothetical protein
LFAGTTQNGNHTQALGTRKALKHSQGKTLGFDPLAVGTIALSPIRSEFTAMDDGEVV